MRLSLASMQSVVEVCTLDCHPACRKPELRQTCARSKMQSCEKVVAQRAVLQTESISSLSTTAWAPEKLHSFPDAMESPHMLTSKLCVYSMSTSAGGKCNRQRDLGAHAALTQAEARFRKISRISFFSLARPLDGCEKRVEALALL